MNDVTRSSQFVANIPKIYDINFEVFFKPFCFCCSFRQIVTYILQ